MEKKVPPPFNEQDHPFNKVFDQIEQLLKIIEQNKEKIPIEIPEWAIKELSEFQKKVESFQKSSAQAIPKLDIEDKKLKQLMRTLPKRRSSQLSAIEEKARFLKERAEVLKKLYSPSDTKQELVFTDANDEERASKDSPMTLLQQDSKKKNAGNLKENIHEHLENKRKYGKIGGRKNWRPI